MMAKNKEEHKDTIAHLWNGGYVISESRLRRDPMLENWLGWRKLLVAPEWLKIGATVEGCAGPVR